MSGSGNAATTSVTGVVATSKVPTALTWGSPTNWASLETWGSSNSQLTVLVTTTNLTGKVQTP